MIGATACSEGETQTTAVGTLGSPLAEAACQDRAEDPFGEEILAEDKCSGETVYEHPLQFLEPVDGLLPIVERKNSPDGGRYAMASSSWADRDDGESHASDGIVSLERRQMDAEERRQYRARFGKEKRPAPQGPSILERAAARVSEMGAEDTDEFFLLIRKSGVGDLTHALEQAVGRGEIYTKQEYESKRAQLLTERQARINAALSPVAKRIEAIGGQVIAAPASSHTLRVRLNPAQVAQALQIPGVSAIDLNYDKLETVNAYTDGVIGRSIMQLDGLIADGYNGNNGTDTDLHAAMFEWGVIQSSHNGYKDGSGAGTRFAGLFNCGANPPSCTAVAAMGGSDAHYIMTSGIFLGDLEDGQDSTVTNQTERRRRSGYATEVNTYLYSSNSENASTAWSHAASRSPKPHVLSMSAGWTGMENSDAQTVGCNGNGIAERQYDETLYESGVLPFISAGNWGGFDSQGTGVCRLVTPASALGAFVVGGYGIPNDYSVCNQRQHPLEPASSRGKGPSWNQGRYRTMIDGAGPFHQNWRFGAGNNYAQYAGGTSLSAPAVAAMAIDLIDHYRNNSGAAGLFDSPGIVHALMLLMGDRTNESGGKKSYGFDSRLGAGRMKARGRTVEELDSPYYFAIGSTCVDDGETVTLKVNYDSNTGVHSPVPGDVNYGKAVAWWYDRRFDDTGELDDIDLHMRQNGSLISQSASNYDEKEMVYVPNVGGGLVTIELTGDDVTADNEGCGTNSMKVFWAYRFEDNDRDDVNGPDYDTSTCIGSETE